MPYESTLKEYFPFWSKLSDDEKQFVIQNTAEISYKSGSNVHSGENDCIGILLVKSGMLRTYMLSEEGKEVTLYRLYPGDNCVLSASCVLKTITFDVFIDAEKDTDVLLIRSIAFSKIMESNPYVQNHFLKTATERFSDVMWAMQQILFMSFDKRLAVFLIDELSKTDGNVIRLTHEQIAKYMGSAREVVSRMLKYFASEGLVKVSRGGIEIIDKKALLKLI